MKTCLLCGVEAPDNLATCVNDGEASWAPARAAKRAVVPTMTKPVEAAVDVEPSPDADVKPKTRRGAA